MAERTSGGDPNEPVAGEDPAMAPADDPRPGAGDDDLEARHVGAMVAHRLFGRPLEPVKVGRYVILERIGAGGLGIVLAAYDPQLERKVAVKIVRADGLGEEQADKRRQRLLREAHAMAKLAHPNVIAVYDAGVVQGQVFVVMELVPGQTLRAWYESGDRRWPDVVDMFVQAGRGLAAAHSAGLIHRDFKPDNVIIGGDGRARVLDFGLARVVTEDPHLGSSDRLVTADLLGASTRPSGSETPATGLVGTPAYVAPEQYEGQEADARSDQFAFAVALYEALYGSHPFFDPEDPQTFGHDLMQGKIRQPPARAGVPLWLQRVVMRGLARDPNGRHPSMEAFLSALRRTPARRRKAAVTGLTMFGAAAALTAWGLLPSERPPEPCSQAGDAIASVWNDRRRATVGRTLRATELPYADVAARHVTSALDRYARSWSDARQHACTATMIEGDQSPELMDLRIACYDQALSEVNGLVDVLVEADAKTVEHAVTAVESLPSLEHCAERVRLHDGPPPPDDPPTAQKVDEIRRQLAEARSWMNAGQEQRALERVQSLLPRAQATSYEPVEAEVSFELGRLQHRTGAPQEAEDTLERAAILAEANRHDALTAQARTELVWVMELLSRVDDGLWWGRLAKATSRRLPYRDLSLDSDLDNHLGVLLDQAGKYDESRKHLERAFEASIALTGREDVSVASIVHNLGVLLSHQGEHEASLAKHEWALDLLERRLGPQHPDTATARDSYAVALSHQGRFEEAREQHQRALEALRAVRGPHDPSLIAMLNGLGSVCERLRRYEDALGYYRNAMEIVEQTLGFPHFAQGALLINVGNVQVGQRSLEDAAHSYEKALEVFEATVGADHPMTAHAHVGLAEVAVQRGIPRRALERVARARTRCEDCDPMLVGQMLAIQARAQHAVGASRRQVQELVQQADEAFAEAKDADHERANLNAWADEALGAPDDAPRAIAQRD